MLTKSDLKAIYQLVKTAIKEEAVTKDEAKSFATKKDLELFATKKDLERFATKKDLIGLARGTEIDDLKITFIDKLEKWKDELYSKIDPILNRVKTAEEENVILRAREEARGEIKDDFDKRISKLEKSAKQAAFPA